MARFTAGSAGFVYILLGRVVFVYFFRISPVKLKFSMDIANKNCRVFGNLGYQRVWFFLFLMRLTELTTGICNKNKLFLFSKLTVLALLTQAIELWHFLISSFLQE